MRVILILALLLSPLERRGRPKDAPIPAAPRQIGGAIAICLGIALLALFGFGDEPADWIDVAAFVFAVGGAAVAGLLAMPRRSEAA